MRRLRFVLVLISAVTSLTVIVLGCSTGGGRSSPDPTIAESCALRCATPRTAGHPCGDQPPPAGCQEACEATLAGKSASCSACFLNNSGWRGTKCTCEGKAGFDIGCSFCTFRGTGESCSVQVLDQCTHGAQTCEGWKPVELDVACAEPCGLPTNTTLSSCENYCRAPTNAKDPCNKATPDQVKACVDGCVTKLTGKTPACMLCFFSGSYWEGQTCSCSGGCEICNWAGNATSSQSACGKANSCSSASQCRGFTDRGIDTVACAATCGVPVGADAGPDADAALDAALDTGAPDAPSDGPKDAPNDG